MKFHIHMLLTCRTYLNHDRDCDLFACQMSISGSVIFRVAGVVSVCYMTLGVS